MGNLPKNSGSQALITLDQYDRLGERFISLITIAIAAAFFVSFQLTPPSSDGSTSLLLVVLLLSLAASGLLRYAWAGPEGHGVKRFCFLSILDTALIYGILAQYALQMTGSLVTLFSMPQSAVLLILVVIRALRFAIPPVLVVSGSVAAGWVILMGLAAHFEGPTFPHVSTGSTADFLRQMGLSLTAEIAKGGALLFTTVIIALAVHRARRMIHKTFNLTADLQEAQTEAEHLALHDPLTGLPNRRYLDRKLQKLIRDRDSERLVGLIHIDLDRFKPINDTYGHKFGDHVLRIVGKILRDESAHSDFVARIGGDEFVVLRKHVHQASDLRDLAGRLVSEISVPIEVDGHKCRLSASLGFATVAAGLADNLLVNADLATYQAKQAGRNCARAYSTEFHQNFQRNSMKGEEILNALDDGQFVPYFQPAFDTRTGLLSSIEVLARWEHPEKGALAPHFFLSFARDLRVLDRLDRIVIEKGLAASERLAAAGLVIPELSFNISSLGFDEVQWLAKKCGRSQHLAFEVYDTNVTGKRADEILWAVTLLREHGASITLDGFGGVNGSITSLLNIRPDKIKLDPKIIRPMPHSEQARKLVRSLVDIGMSYDADVAAVGVETAVHAGLLKGTHCFEIQGFHLSRPLSEAQLLDTWRSGTLGNAAKNTVLKPGAGSQSPQRAIGH